MLVRLHCICILISFLVIRQYYSRLSVIFKIIHVPVVGSQSRFIATHVRYG